MHRWLTAFVFSLILAGAGLAPAAIAADLGTGRPKVVATPEQPPPAPLWSGLYVGVHTGYGWSDVDWQDGINITQDGSGWLLGGQVGYNWQRGRLVYGVEADITGSWVEGSSSGCCEHSVNWLYSLRGRAGITAFDDRTLFYVTAGGAWADVDYTSAFGRHSDTQYGWVFGGGIERALTPNLSARVEYLYYDFDQITARGGSVAAGDTSLDSSLHTVRFGLNYKF